MFLLGTMRKGSARISKVSTASSFGTRRRSKKVRRRVTSNTPSPSLPTPVPLHLLGTTTEQEEEEDEEIEQQQQKQNHIAHFNIF